MTAPRISGARHAVRAVVATVLVLAAGLPAHAETAIPGTTLWMARYDGPAGSFDGAQAVATSPDGSRVFVTGSGVAGRRRPDYETVAYDASTGSELWAARYNGPRRHRDFANALAVSPDGSRVFVTGSSAGLTNDDEDSAEDYATVAYDAATGARLWLRRYDGPGNGTDVARAVEVMPDGSSVAVTGSSLGLTATDYATLAYDAATGRRQWVERYDGPGADADDHASSLGLSPDGSRVFVTGASLNDAVVPNTFVQDFATVAYDATGGGRLWVRHHRVRGGATALEVSPSGELVFVTGYGGHSGSFTDTDYVTDAYDAVTGARVWTARSAGTGADFEIPRDVAVSPDASALFVTGQRSGATTHDDYGTVALDAATGARLWSRRYDGPGHFQDDAAAVGVSADGSQVFVTGVSSGSANIEEFYAEDYATLAYDAATGATRWLRRYNGPGDSSDRATALAVSPIGSTVFVTGTSVGVTSSDDYATVAYGSP